MRKVIVYIHKKYECDEDNYINFLYDEFYSFQIMSSYHKNNMKILYGRGNGDSYPFNGRFFVIVLPEEGENNGIQQNETLHKTMEKTNSILSEQSKLNDSKNSEGFATKQKRKTVETLRKPEKKTRKTN